MRPADYYRGREQTYLKHFFLEHYLERVAYNIGSFASDFVYVDAFAGPWRTEDPDLSDTSPLIATSTLSKIREELRKTGKAVRVRCAFVEEDADAYETLRRAAEQLEDVDSVL